MSGSVPSPVSSASPFSFPAAAALAFTAFATAGASLWLLAVSFTIVPVHDPERAIFWRAIAIALLGFAALSALALRPGRRAAAERVVLGVFGGSAAGVGLGALARMLRMGDADGHFEGYLLVLAIIVASHGLAGLAYAIAGGTPRR